MFEMRCFDTILLNCKVEDSNLSNSIYYMSSIKGVKFLGDSSLEGANILRPVGWLDIEFDNGRGFTRLNHMTVVTPFDYNTKVLVKDSEFPVFYAYILNTKAPRLIQYNSDSVGESFLNFAH